MTHESTRRLEVAREVSDQHSLTRSQLHIDRWRRRQATDLTNQQIRDHRARFILRLRRRYKWSNVAARVENTTSAITQTSLDADLLVQTSRVTTEYRIRNDAAIIIRVFPVDAGAGNIDHRLSSVGLIDHDDASRLCHFGFLRCARSRQRRCGFLPVAEKASG